jgi:subtilisin family serine protease
MVNRSNMVNFARVLIFGVALIASAKAQNPNGSFGKLVVKFQPNTQTEEAKSQVEALVQSVSRSKSFDMKPMFKNHGMLKKVDTKYDLSTIYLLSLASSESIEPLINSLKTLPSVVYAEPLYPIEVFEVPNDPQVASQYYLPLVQAFDAYQITHGDTNIVIGIVDTGTDFLHEDLQANFKYNYNDPVNGVDDDGDGFTDNYRGWDFGEGDNNPQCEYSNHGTMVCGMASAVTNNAVGIASIGYQTRLLAIKVMDDAVGDMSTAYQGIVYAADNGCQIINCSWGGTAQSMLGADVIDYAVNFKNCMVVAAAGNSSVEQAYYPASYNGVFNVTATDIEDLKWTKSTFGIEVDICAPGNSVRSTNQNSTYSNGSGTSMASPLVAGAAALLKAIRPELDAHQLAEQLRITSDIIDTITDNQYFYRKMGFGRLNAYRALTIDYLPSVRIEDFKATTNGSEALLSGDKLTVSFSATNLLNQVSNCIIKILSNSDYLIPINDNVSTGFLDTYETVNFNEGQMAFSLSSELPQNQEVLLTFDFQAQVDDGTVEGGVYRDYQVFKVILNKTYINIEINKIATTVTSNGSIGYDQQKYRTGQGFIYNRQDNILNAGGIILATDKDHVVSALFSNLDFTTIKLVDTSSVNENLLVANATYQIGQDGLLPLTIEQSSFAYRTGAWESSIIHEYKITNTGSNAIGNLHMALFADWDIDKTLNNSTGYQPDQHLFYTSAHANQLMYTGICLINQNTSLPYGFDIISGGNGGMDITQTYSNEQKWFTMQNSRPVAGNDGDTINVATQLTTGPYAVETGDSLTLIWAMIAAKSWYELTSIAQSLREDYVLSIQVPDGVERVSIYPNPANELISINNLNPTQEYQLLLYDVQGHQVQYIKTKGTSAKIDVGHLKPGIYLLQVDGNGGKTTHKILRF